MTSSRGYRVGWLHGWYDSAADDGIRYETANLEPMSKAYGQGRQDGATARRDVVYKWHRNAKQEPRHF